MKRTAAELAALYAQYPGLEEAMAAAAYADYHNTTTLHRAEAHALAQESGRMQREFDEAKPHGTNRSYL